MGVKFKVAGDSKLNDNPALGTAFVKVWGRLQKLCGIFKQIVQQERELLCGRML